jgi:hypothetical protein
MSIKCLSNLPVFGDFLVGNAANSSLQYANVCNVSAHRCFQFRTSSHPLTLYKGKFVGASLNRKSAVVYDTGMKFLCMSWLNCPIIASLYNTQFRFSSKTVSCVEVSVRYLLLSYLQYSRVSAGQ